ncbi:iron donor protein CyaY, putative [Acanthamoeba castellanii str. Neff]|uniref:ferroxidase n=1 Tax=Acanthamoeba castellanii (strain ATCC 30010 / Neff) TaxID=1257118 RepID=L8GRF3_ACACF|nr:iron donor protein CyaY, putative [Acanthamoeba castellanii str. Neff]ELR15228.1 iron donor protein CyaY, putative [Acanthamoeba castellanii str. Neff]
MFGSARHARHLATSAEPPSAGEFAKAAEETLEDLQDRLEEAGLDEDLDISYSDGVLTIRLGDKGTYVINKQTPNRQLWFSSPISGPKRFDYVATEGKWLDTREREPLHQLLYAELEQLTGVSLS